jgi:alanine-synthesizing transaminase
LFSQRLPSTLSENALSVALEARRAAGRPLLDLTESNPTRAGIVYPEHDLLDAIAPPGSLSYQPDPKGLRTAREAVARYLLESQRTVVAPEQIFLTASTSEAYGALFKLLCDPGDCVLIPAPSYPLFELLAGLEGVRAVSYPLLWDGEWHVDLASLEAILAAEPRARAILVVSPGNPTGAYLKTSEHARLTSICAARHLALIADEVFADYPSGSISSRVQRTCAVASEALAFTLSGLSKTCGLPQLKLGWCAVTGPGSLVQQASARLELISDTYLSVATPVQLALPRLLELRHPIQRQIQERCAANRKMLQTAREADAGWDLLAAEAGWSAILRIPDSLPEEGTALALLENGVLVQPGYFYEFERGNFLVLSLLAPERSFASAMPALADALR